MKLGDKYQNLLDEGYVAFIATAPWNLPHINKKPLGLEAAVIDTDDVESEIFLDLLNQGDGASYGEKEMPMPKWVQVNCGTAPSAFVGLALPVYKLPKDVKTKLSIPNTYKGLVPVAAACALPTKKEDVYLAHTLWALEKNKGLGTLGKALNIAVHKCKEMYGVTQYDNVSLMSHTKFGDLKIKSVFTPGHTYTFNTFTYTIVVQENTLENALSDKDADVKKTLKASFLLNPNDMDQKMEMYEKKKQGYSYYILPPGQIEIKEKPYVPIKEMELSKGSEDLGRCL